MTVISPNNHIKEKAVTQRGKGRARKGAEDLFTVLYKSQLHLSEEMLVSGWRYVLKTYKTHSLLSYLMDNH